MDFNKCGIKTFVSPRVIGYDYITMIHRITGFLQIAYKMLFYKNYISAISTNICGSYLSSPSSKQEFLGSKPVDCIVTNYYKIKD